MQPAVVALVQCCCCQRFNSLKEPTSAVASHANADNTEKPTVVGASLSLHRRILQSLKVGYGTKSLLASPQQSRLADKDSHLKFKLRDIDFRRQLFVLLLSAQSGYALYFRTPSSRQISPLDPLLPVA